MEFIGLMLLMCVVGVALLLVGGLLLLPIYVALKLLGFGLRIAFHVLGFVLGVFLILPLALFVGTVLILKLLVLTLPLLVLGLVIWAVRAMARPATAL